MYIYKESKYCEILLNKNNKCLFSYICTWCCNTKQE